MSKFKALLPLTLALVVSALAGVLEYQYLKNREVEVIVEKTPIPKVPVVVAAANLTWGTRLTGEMLRVSEYLEGTAPTGHFTTAEDLEGRIILHPLADGEPIVEGKLAATDVTRGGVSALISKGKRAMAVKGNMVLGMAGLVSPGDRVDVLVTMNVTPETAAAERADAPPEAEISVTKLVLENILLLATGTRLEPKENGGEVSPVDVYTVEVTPEEAEMLALAETQGTLHFALRNSVDTDTVLTMGATKDATLASYRINSPQPVGSLQEAKLMEPDPMYAPEPPSFEVETIKGNEIEVVSF